MMKDDAPKTQRPDNTAFTQQRLPAWQPILSVGIVVPLFFLIGMAFIGIGLGLYFTSKSIKELEFDYTGVEANSSCHECINTTENCLCEIEFTLNDTFLGPVFFYYGLSNFYQNNRRYGISRDDNQLYGDKKYIQDPGDYCNPYRVDEKARPIAPCGAIANGLFNDTFKLFYLPSEGVHSEVPLDGKGISWWTDYNIKFQNPSFNGSLKEAFNGTVKPPNWRRPVYELDTDATNNGFLNEDFIVWMRTAALPTFRKLYRRIQTGNFSEGLPAGKYKLKITYNYPVISFQGRKKVVFSSVSWMGGKNPFLGIAYLVFGSICIVLGLVTLFVHLNYGNQDNSVE
ncbi:cell cycle control protein 50B [Latimeria chalumnae]|uniref:Cell cycle control protein n=1 Tax=Latimeria chalumnae TaxID=7897 RepID=H3AE82_LATCH|nr:PREDICTED: cell cycle control protein 50B-like [Latimeria chalumnae]|eukprot:XP_006008851.1 PREDICTED: cell cycle control protein 50B-like [Latimeria chalumnae]